MIHVRYAIARKGLPAASAFRTWADAALRGARRRGPVEIGIRLVDGTEGRELNQHYRGKAYATNVLSFAAELPAGIRLPLLGDVVMCAPVIAREAAEQGKSLRDHYAHMTIHGVLHLLGYDHIDATQATRMERLERRILAGLSVADPY